jgi:hypothetical protein
MARTVEPTPVVEVISVFEDQHYPPHTRTIRRWRVTVPGTSFVAEIPECSCGLRKITGTRYVDVPFDAPDWATRPREVAEVFSVPMIECLCAYEYGRCTRATAKDRGIRCHGWHQARIDRLVDTLTGRVRPVTLASRQRQLAPVSDLPLMPISGWPDRRASPITAAQHQPCGCASCVETIERFPVRRGGAGSR